MANTNLGPAVTSNASSQAVLANQVTPNFGEDTQGTNTIRILARGRAIPIAAGTGDIAALPLINCSSFIVTAIYFTNAYSVSAAGVVSSASAAALTVSVNGGPAVTGLDFVASAALTALTGNTKYVSSTIALAANTSSQTATMGTSGAPSNYIYINSTVVSAAAQFMDCFIYGYDIT